MWQKCIHDDVVPFVATTRIGRHTFRTNEKDTIIRRKICSETTVRLCVDRNKSIFVSILKPYPFFLKLGFTPCKAEQPLQGMELQEKETQKD